MARITNLPRTQKVMSIRGTIVDFAELKSKQKSAKQQLINTPKTEEIRKRERFIDRKRRRSTAPRGTIDQLLAEQQHNKEMVKQALLTQVAKSENTANTDKIENPFTEDVTNVPPVEVSSEDVVPTGIVPIIKK